MYKLLLLLLLLPFFSFGQFIERSTLSSLGSYYENDEIIFESTSGESSYTFLSNDFLIISQGFHQPIWNLSTANPEIEISEENFNAYPNPASDIIHLTRQKEDFSAYELLIFDQMGRLQKQYFFDTPTPSTNAISIADFPAGKYQLLIRTVAKNFIIPIIKAQ